MNQPQDPDIAARDALRLIGPDPQSWVPDIPGIDHNVTIVGGGHPWPGGLQATHETKVVPGARYSASTAILDFFEGLGR